MPLQNISTSSYTFKHLGIFALTLPLLRILNVAHNVFWARRLDQEKLLLAEFLVVGIRCCGILPDRVVLKNRGYGWDGRCDDRSGRIRVWRAGGCRHHR